MWRPGVVHQGRVPSWLPAHAHVTTSRANMRVAGPSASVLHWDAEGCDLPAAISLCPKAEGEPALPSFGGNHPSKSHYTLARAVQPSTPAKGFRVRRALASPLHSSMLPLCPLPTPPPFSTQGLFILHWSHDLLEACVCFAQVPWLLGLACMQTLEAGFGLQSLGHSTLSSHPLASAVKAFHKFLYLAIPSKCLSVGCSFSFTHSSHAQISCQQP